MVSNTHVHQSIGTLSNLRCSLWKWIRGCLHDTGATFVPERVHSGSLSWLCICLHETTTKCHAGSSHPGVSSPRFLYRGEISLRYEISQRYHVNAKRPPVSVGKHYMVAHHIVVRHKLIEHCAQRLVSSTHFSKLLFSVLSTPRLSLVSFYVLLCPY